MLLQCSIGFIRKMKGKLTFCEVAAVCCCERGSDTKYNCTIFYDL